MQCFLEVPPSWGQVPVLKFIQLIKAYYVLGTESAAVKKRKQNDKSDTSASKNNSSAEGTVPKRWWIKPAEMCPALSRVKLQN